MDAHNDDMHAEMEAPHEEIAHDSHFWRWKLKIGAADGVVAPAAVAPDTRAAQPTGELSRAHIRETRAQRLYTRARARAALSARMEGKNHAARGPAAKQANNKPTKIEAKKIKQAHKAMATPRSRPGRNRATTPAATAARRLGRARRPRDPGAWV